MVCLHTPYHTAAHQVTTQLQSVHGTCESESTLEGYRLLCLKIKKENSFLHRCTKCFGNDRLKEAKM